MLKYKLILIAFITLLTLHCASPNRLTVSPDTIASGLTTVIQSTLPYLIDETIQQGGETAYNTWVIVDRSIVDLIQPLLDGKPIRINDLGEWLSVITPKSNVDQKIIRTIEMSINLIIAFIPTDDLKTEIDSGQTSKDVIGIVVDSLQALHDTINAVLTSYRGVFGQ